MTHYAVMYNDMFTRWQMNIQWVHLFHIYYACRYYVMIWTALWRRSEGWHEYSEHITYVAILYVVINYDNSISANWYHQRINKI